MAAARTRRRPPARQCRRRPDRRTPPARQAALDAPTTAAPDASGAPTTAPPGSTDTTAAPTTAPPAPAPPAPPAPGTYVYAQSGSSSHGEVPAKGTLTVDPVDGNGAQTWHRAVDPSAPASDITYVFRSDGPFIANVVTRASGFEFDCPFDPLLPAPPWPESVGLTISGHSECGSITVDVQGRITGQRTVTLDGESVDVIVVETTTTTYGQINSTATDVQWWAPALALTVHTERHQEGKFAGLAFSSDITSDLVSRYPR